MPNVTLAPGGSQTIPGTAEVKVSNTTATQGQIQVTAPNVPSVTYDVAAGGSRNIQIPVGDTVFKNTGTVNLQLSW
jgi:hypothetical protein